MSSSTRVLTQSIRPAVVSFTLKTPPRAAYRTLAALLVACGLVRLAAVPAHGAAIAFDGGETHTGSALDLGENWVPDGVPGTADEALFANSVEVVTLPAQLTVGSDLTFGDLLWNSADSSTIALASGAANYTLTLSGGSDGSAAVDAGGTESDLILLGSNAVSGTTVTIGGNAASEAGQLQLALGKAGNFNVVNAGATLAVSAPISGAFALTKTGAGTLVLSGANTYSGGTNIESGTVQLNGGNNRLATNGALRFTGTAGTLDLGSNSQSVAGISFQTAGTTSATITGAGGSLTVTGGHVQIGGGDATNASSAQTVDMSGLGTFTYAVTGGNFNIGGHSDAQVATTTASGTLTLAQTNTITAASLNVGSYNTGASALNSGYLHLGQTNTVNANTILVGNLKTTAVMDFQDGLTAPTLKIRGTAGGTSRAAITVGINQSGLTATDATFDLTNGGTVSSTLDALVSTFIIGQNTRNDAGVGLASRGTFTMGLGTLDATTLILGQQGALTGTNNSGPAIATLNLNGGTISATTLTLADKLASATPQTITSNLNLYSGTLAAGTIRRGAAGTGVGANTATINFNWVDGTISNINGANQTVTGNTEVNGLTGGLTINLNNTGNTSGTHTWNVGGNQTSTVQSSVILAGPGSLTKTGTGTLVLGGVNTYEGTTTVAGGTLRFATTATFYGYDPMKWTAENLIVNSGATAAFNVGAAGEFIEGDIELLRTLGTATGGFRNGSSIGFDTTNTDGGNFYYTGSITNLNGGSNVLGLAKLGSGTLTLTSVQGYTGITNIAGGTLALLGNNRLSTTGTLTFTGTDGTLDLGPFRQSLAAMTFPITGNNSYVITGDGGTLSLSNSNFQVGGGNATQGGFDTLDMSGLSTFNYTSSGGTFSVGGRADVGVSVPAGGTLTLARTNTITAGTFSVSPYSSGNSSPNTGIVHLGQTNVINASTINIGVGKATSVLDFQNLVNPTVRIRGTGGTNFDRATTVIVGTNDSGASTSISTLDLSGGTTDALIGTLTIGRNTRNIASGAGLNSTGIVTMGAGTLDATTIVVGQQTAVTGSNISGTATATLNLNGGTIAAATLTLADKLAPTTVQTITSTFNLNSGTLKAGTIQRGTVGTGAGANTATINFNWVDGTISNLAGLDQTVSGTSAVNGLTGGLTINLNNTGNVSGTHTWNVDALRTATIQNTATLSGTGGLTKTGAGTLIFSGINSYTGPTTVSAGVLQLNATGGSSIAGDLIVNGGTATLLQANQIASSQSLTVNGGTFALQGFNQSLANVQLTGGSVTGTTGVLTSTLGFDLQSGSISAILGGDSAAIKTTGGTVTLSGANTFTGGTIVNEGTLIATKSSSLGAIGGLTVNTDATFAYRPTAAGALALGNGPLLLADGSTLGVAASGTLGQSMISSSMAAAAGGSIDVELYGIPDSAITAGEHTLLSVGGGLTSASAIYNLTRIYNATNFTVSNFQFSDTALKATITSATALTTAYWKGGLGAADSMWALSNGTSSNWTTDSAGAASTALVPGSAAAVNFSATGAANQGAMTLGANMIIKSLTVSGSSPVTLDADGNTLTIAGTGSLTVNSGAGAVTLNAPIITGGAQTWANNSTNLLTVGGDVTLGGTLSVGGSRSTVISGAIGGAFGVTVTGGAKVTLSGDNTFTGGVGVNSNSVLTLTGDNSRAGGLSIGTGTVNLSGNYSAGFSLGNTTNGVAVLNILPGANIVGSNAGGSVGNSAGAVGVINQSGGTFIMNQQINLGAGGTVAAPSYGFYNLTGGSIVDAGGTGVRFRMGGGASNSVGVFYQSGGSVEVKFSSGLEVGGNGTGNYENAVGVGYLTGGTVLAFANRIGFNSVTTSTGGVRGEQTVDGTSAITIVGNTTLAQAAGDIGILNLNGGTYATRQINRGHASGLSIVNFDGGTLVAASGATGGSFFTGLTQANVYAGGLAFNSNNQSITIAQALRAPTGDGVTSIAVDNGGSGYVGAPYVSIDGDGTGATAVANLVDDGTGKGTFKIASITITSPGTGYTTAPTVTLRGGGGSGAVLGTVDTATNVSGGLTKIGAGTLTLTGASDYTGPTVVSEGTLLVSGSLVGEVQVSEGAIFGGSGGSVGPITVATGGTVSPGAVNAIGTLTSGPLSLDRGGIFKLEINTTANTTDLLSTTGAFSLSTTGAPVLSITDLAPGSGGEDLVFLTYTGAWNGGLFSVGGALVFDGGTLTIGNNAYFLDYDYNGNSVALIPVPVPEPGTFVSLASGLGLLAGLQRFRRRARR